MATPSETLTPGDSLLPSDSSPDTERNFRMTQVQTHYRPGTGVTAIAGEDLVAGTFVKATGAWDTRRNVTVSTAAAKDIPEGFVRTDTKKGEYVTVDRAGWVVDLKTAGSLKAGDLVAVGAAGAAAKAADGDHVVGTAWADTVDGFTAIAVK